MTVMRTEFQLTRKLPHSVTWPGIPGHKASPKALDSGPLSARGTIMPGSTPPTLILGEALCTVSSGATGPHLTLGYGPWQHEPQKWGPVLGGGHFLILIRPPHGQSGAVSQYIYFIPTILASKDRWFKGREVLSSGVFWYMDSIEYKIFY